MRITTVATGLALALLATTGAARAEHRGSAMERARATNLTLSVGEIDAQVKPVSAEIGRCYLDAAAHVRGAGKLVVQLEIHRTGSVDGVTVSTPGLPAKLARQIETCVRGAVEPLAFPARKRPTTAVVPYFFQHTAAPNSGPQLSCWNPKGCA